MYYKRFKKKVISIEHLKKKTPEILLTLLGIIILLIIPIQIKSSESNIYGPRFFPYILSVLLIIFSLISFFMKSDMNEMKGKLKKASNLRVLVVLILMVVWVFLSDIIGFVISTYLFSISTMLIMGNRNRLQLLLVPIFLTGIIYYIFSELLDIFLPSNIFF